VIAWTLYRMLWWALTPALAVVSALHPRLRVRWRERWTLALPAVEPGCVVVHGASVGEGRAAQAILLALRAHRPRRTLLRCAFTDTGLATARGHDALAALPFDAPWAVRRWLDRVRPRALVLVESELWPALLAGCAARGIPVAVAGARAGAGMARFSSLTPGLWARMDGAVSVWLAKDEAGAVALRERVSGEVVVAGEPKADAPLGLAGLTFSRPWVVAGSTRPGDEAALLSAAAGLAPRPVVVLAPRHRERFDAVAGLLIERGERWIKRSETADGRVEPEVDVLLLDTVGELAGYYPGAAAAFVGGTFDDAIGGHSPAEASAAGLPVVAGPARAANAAAWASARLFEAASPAQVGPALTAALADRAGEGTPEHGGRPTARIAARVAPLLDSPVPPERVHRPLLAPLSAVWAALARTRGAALTPERAATPVVSVGNLASGGTGKTPVVAWVLGALEDAGRRPAVLSRGYGRGDGPALRVAGRPGDPPPDGAWLGDEPAELARGGRLVVSCPDRRAGARAAAAAGADVVVMDDGFQHRRLARDVDIVVVDAIRPLAGGVIPAGELREGLPALARAHAVWVNHGPLPEALRPHLRPGAVVVEASYRPICWVRGQEERAIGALAGEVQAFAGIARPGRFLQSLLELGLTIGSWTAFPDHHRFTEAELARLAALPAPLVTTEKDLTRLPPGLGAWGLRVRCVPEAGGEALKRLLMAAVEGQ